MEERKMIRGVSEGCYGEDGIGRKPEFFLFILKSQSLPVKYFMKHRIFNSDYQTVKIASGFD